MKYYLIFTFLIWNALFFGQSSFEVSGFVYDQNNIPLQLKVIFTNNLTVQEIITSPDGFFLIKVNQGDLNIVCQYNDLIVYNENYSIVANLNLNIKINDKNILETIVVTNKLKPKVVTIDKDIYKLNLSQTANIPSPSGVSDIVKILQLTPGVQNSGDVNGYLYFRGGDAGHSIFKYNEIPVYGSPHLFGIFPFYNTFHIGEVIFDKTNLSSFNGDNLGASIIMKPSLDSNKKVSVSANFGFLCSQFNTKIRFGKSKLSVSYRKTYLNEFLKAFSIRNDASYKFDDVNVSFASQLSKKTEISFDFFKSADLLIYSSEELFANINLNWKNTIFGSKIKHLFSDKFRYQMSLYYSGNLNYVDVNQVNLNINIENSIQDICVKNNFDYQVNKLQMHSGLILHNYQIKPYNLVLTNFGFDPNKNYESTNSNQISFYNDVDVPINDNLLFKAGIKINYFKENNFKANYSFEPKLGLYFNENKTANYFMTLARKTQNINLVATSSVGIPTDFWISSNSLIPIQTSNEVTTGLNYNFNKTYNFSASLFYNTIDNLTIYPLALSQFNETKSLQNDIIFGNGTNYGFEFIAKKDLGKLKGWTSYTWSKSIRNFDEINNGNAFFSKYDRRHNFSATVIFEISNKFNLGLIQVISSGNRYTSASDFYLINNTPIKQYNDFNNAQLPIYNRTDLSINYQLNKSKLIENKISLSFYNLFNISNPVFQYDTFENNNNQVNILKKEKVFYKLLPSINWFIKL